MTVIATFNLSGKRKKGEVLHMNKYTVWVKLKNGDIVKRHKVKHNVLIKS